MVQLINLQKLVKVMVITAVTLGTGMVHHAFAYETYAPACHYRTVIKFEYHTEKFVTWVIEVDNYGCEHRVPVVKYRTVKVPVKHLVKVCHD